MKDKSFDDGWNDPRSFVFGNGSFGGYYIPGEFEFRMPGDLSSEEFEKIFADRIKSLHKKGRKFTHHHFDMDDKSNGKKERLQPLSVRVKHHTKEFLKNDSILSAREILELYEDFNNGSEAFINSLLEEENQLQKNLEEIQEKLHNARLFKEKLTKIEIEEDDE